MDGCLGTRSWIGELTLILLTSRWLIPICVLIRQWVFCVRLRTTLTLNLWFGICTASRSSPLITVGDHQPTYCMCKCMHFSELEWFHNLTASNLSHLRVCSFHGYENDIATWGIACSGNNWSKIHLRIIQWISTRGIEIELTPWAPSKKYPWQNPKYQFDMKKSNYLHSSWHFLTLNFGLDPLTFHKWLCCMDHHAGQEICEDLQTMNSHNRWP